MPPHSIGSGTLSFGLVSIPVKMFTAASSANVSFNLLHEKCGGRIKQQMVCPTCNVTVERSSLVRGYEFSKDQYVVFTEDEIKSMAEEASKTIEITEFVPLAKVDPIYFEGAYYLGPDKGGEKAYRLLSEAMRQTGRCALAKWAARGKQYLTLMRPIDNGIIMQVLHYADEVRPFSEIPVGDAAVKEPELKLAVQLIEQIATDEFKPESYVDDVRARYHEAIQRKVEGQEVTSAAAPEAPKGQIIDLMEALKASLAQKGPRAVPAAASAPAETAKPAKRAAAARTTEARTLRAPKAAAGGKRR